MNCNVLLYLPNAPSLLNLSGYIDFARTVDWGLRKLGHESFLTTNSILNDAKYYFIFGGHLLPHQLVSTLRGKVFFVNLEQLHGFNYEFSELSPTMQHVIENFTVLDYSRKNAGFWARYGKVDVIYFPPRYGDNLLLGEKRMNKDIDVLYYGNLGFPNATELDYKTRFLRNAIGGNKIRPKAVMLQNDYQGLRNELLSRSKIVLSVTSDKVFPTVRSQLLLANAVPIISSIRADDYIDENFRNLLDFSTEESVNDDIKRALEKYESFELLSRERSEIFKSTPITNSVRELLNQ